MDDKVIVTNKAALLAKYGSSGVKAVKQGIDALVAADAVRGIRTRLVYLDQATSMKPFGRHLVKKAADPRQNKEAIDAVFRGADPEYLMILGATDVVPHQDLRNPLYKPGDDDDVHAYGDLPYACDAAYSRDITRFRGPTRVISRLPDLTGAKDAGHLLKLLKIAATHRSRAPADYTAYFGLSAQSWKESTGLSLENVFGRASNLRVAPASGPAFTAQQLGALAHFINCHGAGTDDRFYGQKGEKYPTAMQAAKVKGKIRNGTIAAVECCYGAELYDSVTLSLPIPICQQYLADGTYGYLGSTTIAYGPATGNGLADLLTQYFLLALLEGASVGRAALLARQKFVGQAGELDPYDLKTLGQFNVLGDPSIHPVKLPNPTGTPKGVAAEVASRQQRRERRARMKLNGEFLQDTKPTAARKAVGGRRSAAVKQALGNISRMAGIGAKREFTAYAVSVPTGMRRGLGKAANAVASRYYVTVYRPRPGGGLNPAVGAVAKEVDGRIVGFRIYEEKSWRARRPARSGSKA